MPDDHRITSAHQPYQLVDIAHIMSNNSDKIGKLYISMAPGKKDSKWNRDLDEDLECIINHDIDIVVCLLQWSELNTLNIIDYPLKAQELGLTFFHLPIKDRNVPLQKDVISIIPIIVHHLAQGKNILIHCRAGLGRAGLICACCLIHFGYGGRSAIDVVRTLRPYAIQTTQQEDCVISYGNYLTTGL